MKSFTSTVSTSASSDKTMQNTASVSNTATWSAYSSTIANGGKMKLIGLGGER
jgi:hypothetical protein